MGLPALWKAPHDFADHEETFWKYGHAFFQRANSVHVTNNPLLFEQLRYAFGKDDTSRMRILRPHNRYMNVLLPLCFLAVAILLLVLVVVNVYLCQ